MEKDTSRSGNQAFQEADHRRLLQCQFIAKVAENGQGPKFEMCLSKDFGLGYLGDQEVYWQRKINCRGSDGGLPLSLNLPGSSWNDVQRTVMLAWFKAELSAL